MSIHIEGAGEHNLKDVDLEFGAGLTVVTGVSGSGKTSLVFDTLYHEARRRFLELFSLGSSGERLSPARVRSITGLGPAIAVGQNLLNRNPNSTLATACGLHPFLRLLYANFGVRACPKCGAGLQLLAEEALVERLGVIARGGKAVVFASLFQQAPGSHRILLELLAGEFGPGALRVDGRPWRLETLDPDRTHSLQVQVAEFDGEVPAGEARRAVQSAAALGANAINVIVIPVGVGLAPTLGAGASRTNLNVVQAFGRPAPPEGNEILFSIAPVCAACGTWFSPLEPAHFHIPCPKCRGEGAPGNDCPECAGTGLHPQAAAVRWNGLRLTELLARPVYDAAALLARQPLPRSAQRLQDEIARRLEALDTVGLGYLTLDRPAPSLSRGEAQRARLAVALTGRLEDMLHVLDEPTIGQHPADVARLLPAFRRLAGPVIYVEHDRVAAAVADQAVDLGPGAGAAGGRVVFSGSPAGLWQADTPTGRYFSLRARVAAPNPRPAPRDFLVVRHASLRNLQNIDVPIPLGRLTVVTGVSGSGKSTLVEDVLVASLAKKAPLGCRAVEGPPLDPVIVDQSPIGLNPRSNPATYTKLADIIRDAYAAATGLSASRFSFNRPEGACPSCAGMGAIEVQMRYLPSTWIPCAACAGQRFSDEVLAARASFSERSLSIADFYTLSVAEALPLLAGDAHLTHKNRQTAANILSALRDIGLGYLPLGQPSPSLSGGEAQRVKLAKYLGKNLLSGQLLVLDEPSTGLHPQDVTGLLVVLDRLVRSGATIVVVEHNTDIIRSADWIVDLGPGAGAAGGRLIYAGPFAGLDQAPSSLTAQALRDEATLQPNPGSPGALSLNLQPSTFNRISIRGARAHNLKGVDVNIPKGALTVVTGVSGSGKSSLVGDVLESEARRRFLETLSMYERQSTREGPEAPVDTITGLGVAVAVGPDRGRYNRRATVGTHTELSHHLAALLASIGERRCLDCGTPMERGQREWTCPACGGIAPIPEPRFFSSTTYGAACRACHGVGTQQEPRPEKLIIHPEKPLLGGAMYSPGFFPQGYLGKPFNGGYDMVQGLAAHFGFDPARTPWNEMTPQAQHAFLYGLPEPIPVTFISRTGRTHSGMHQFPGFYGWIRDWDVGGTYTETRPCPVCQGAGLRPEYLAVTLGGVNISEMSQMPLSRLARVVETVAAAQRPSGTGDPAAAGLRVVRHRLRYLIQVGLGYLHLDRIPATLSAGEAQRVKLAGLLGSGLTALTVLLDEPSRGLHPAEVNALQEALFSLREEGNTVIVVEHDPQIVRSADTVIDMGPGAGVRGGQVIARGTPQEVARADTPTGRWLRRLGMGAGVNPVPTTTHGNFWDRERREPGRWMEIHGARANNLHGDPVRFPLGALVGVCGPSGSGKSTLIIDTLGRALAPKKQTTSVAYEPVAPGEHDAILGAPARAILVNQARAGVTNPADFLGLSRPLRSLFAASEDAHLLGLDEKALGRGCSACGGSGLLKTDLGFLPDIYSPCDACRGTGFLPEAWEVRLYGQTLPELFSLTLDEVYDLLGEEQALARPLAAARQVGLGYLVLRQPGVSLSGGEAQRLKIAQELCRKTPSESLYILDEPTVGQHMEDVARLAAVLHGLVEAGHTVLVVEHHPHLLAACDWLVELGPGGGPDGGRVIAAGTPEDVAQGSTPTAPYLQEIL